MKERNWARSCHNCFCQILGQQMSQELYCPKSNDEVDIQKKGEGRDQNSTANKCFTPVGLNVRLRCLLSGTAQK